jgi:hypothetical protein
MAVDRSANLNKPEVSEWFKGEFLRRQIVDHENELEVKTNFTLDSLKDVDVQQLVKDDELAHQFAEKNRKVLNIPPGTSFQVLPRIQAEKMYYDVDRNKVKVKECIFKVAWEESEPNLSGYSLPDKRAVRRGTTLAVDVEKRMVRFILSSDKSDRQRDNRNLMLNRLMDDRLLRIDKEGTNDDGQAISTMIPADTSGGLLHIRGAARMLHISR